jgi:hypothetical protein
VEPCGEWSVEFFPNPDGDMQEGDILVDSELLLPANPELGIGERTRLVTTVHSGQRDSKPFAKLEYDDTAGHHSVDIKNSVTIGRGGVAHPVDIKIVSSADVSREHARIRRDSRTGVFFLIDLSTLGTTLNTKLTELAEKTGPKLRFRIKRGSVLRIRFTLVSVWCDHDVVALGAISAACGIGGDRRLLCVGRTQ